MAGLAEVKADGLMKGTRGGEDVLTFSMLPHIFQVILAFFFFFFFFFYVPSYISGVHHFG